MHTPGRRRVQRTEELEQRALARSAGSLDGYDLARLDVEVDVAQRHHLGGSLEVAPPHGAQLVEVAGRLLGHPRSRSAEAGERRDARQPPNAPAMSPPTLAKRMPSRMVVVLISASRCTVCVAD